MTTKKVSIFYFSGTGNTWWVGSQLVEALNQKDFQAQATSIEQLTKEAVLTQIEQSDIVGLGYPIYGSDAPQIMKDFIRDLPDQKSSKPLLIYITQMAWSGNGAYFMRHELERKGYQVRWAVHFNMPNNIGMDVFPVWSSPDFEKFQPQLAKRKQQAQKLANKIAQNQSWIHSKNPAAWLTAWIQRGPFRLMHKWGQNRTWSVDPERCTHCGRCERLCPVENIHLEDGLPVFGDQCNYCLRCYNFCPEQAILALKRPFNTKRGGKQPYQGPIPAFRPEILTKKKEKAQN